jgi:ABC-type Fe3+/spermidine/putrescine transport system ATPase subunit
MARLSLEGVTKRFGSTTAVSSLSLEIGSGEFFALLGPSGCGKSTLLRLIAGLEHPSEGRILLNGRDITGLAPKERGIGLVFQNYALFPHMTVEENVAYGLHGRGIPREEIRNRVAGLLRSVGLEGSARASVTTLSGGEQQRVAVARAMVVEPAVLLFDEPLSNLDVALRQRTREEIRGLQRRTGITTVYVTHDQGEALTLADRLAVMRRGVLEQMGEPRELYEHPVSGFVAEFLGGANLIDSGGGLRIDPELARRLGPGEQVAIKPEGILISSRATPGSQEGVVMGREYLGFTTLFTIRAGETLLRVLSLTAAAPAETRAGDRVHIAIDWSQAVVCRSR